MSSQENLILGEEGFEIAQGRLGQEEFIIVCESLESLKELGLTM